ncbi:MAG: N-acetylneuraminate synthase [Gammaproteobacteria bacterium]|nr:N-acetylneuraminate synthase [Gammaproteobacteria bacterium]
MTAPRAFVIAEAGVNHNGSLSLAGELVDAAVEAGADAVKFQTFRADRLVEKSAPRAAYQQRNTGSNASQYEMLKALELDADSHRVLRDQCDRRGIEFMSTAFDLESLDFLVGDIGIRRVKIPSGEAVNGPLLLAAIRTGLPVILSTGMCTHAEVMESLAVLAWGEEHPVGNPKSRAAIAELGRRPGFCRPLHSRVALLQCVTQYPAPAAGTNLRAMLAMGQQTGLQVGLSDHTEGWHVTVAAVAAGAAIVEKHFTMSRSLPGPDHAASLEAHELARMIREIREVEAAMGTGVKEPAVQEIANRIPARGSLVAAVPIRKGDAYTASNLTIRRPGTGVSPMAYWDYVSGRRAGRDYGQDEQIDP